MQFLKVLGEGRCKRAELYDCRGEKIVILRNRKGATQRRLLRYSRKESGITSRLPELDCNIGSVQVNRKGGKWEISSRYVQGAPLNKTLLDSLSAEKREKLTADFAAFLLALHTLTLDRRDERYADQTVDETHPLLYRLGKIFHRIATLKKTYLSFSKPRGISFDTRAFERQKREICKRFAWEEADQARLEKVIRTVCAHSDMFSYVGVCFTDFHSSNFVYDEEQARLGVLDFGNCSYKGIIYYEFVTIYTWLGKEFTQELIRVYNALAKRDAVHLGTRHLPLEIDLSLVQHYLILSQFQKLPRFPNRQENVLHLLREIYPE